ncbi:SusD-like starch-binding protein associating with outer membrane [Chitinophaga polysaccharea]|uniref:SusD-like starch-binding protein associating with outer membrane n=1 Tax=Chitinophaga polysaccharea TaxID=1293035 RepID=A0A561PT03_9BACT|nr:RagB/SusD family nutrient uptake outer membrane protein [Chitinophaga polysaccharea]TWF41235.1 SusD-like starch-binding protein associating with outer membrane [Chitinophaga polysaccharea]
MNCLKNIFTVMAAGLMLSPLVSCRKLLNQDPINSPYSNVFWQNQRDAEQGAAGGYALLRRALTTNTDWDQSMSHFAYGSLPAFEFADYTTYDVRALVKGGDGFSNADFLGSYLDKYHDWSPYYKIITQANIMLHNIPNIPDNQFTDNPTRTRNRFLGEAYFLRAFSYFYMARIWGDVPAVFQYDADPAHSTNIPRTSEKTILDSCVSDLKNAIRLLPWEYKSGTERAVRANRGAAFGLLAHVYMWKNFLNKGQVISDVTNAIAAVDSVENSGMYQLEPYANYPKVFHGKSNEGIFEINMQAANGEQQIQTGFYYSLMKAPFIYNKSSKVDVVNLDLIYSLYDVPSSDVRTNYFFSGLTDNSNAYDVILCKFAGPNRENISYKNPGDNSGASVDANIMLLRYADLLLLRAEAYADQGNEGAALQDINTVRARAQATPRTADDIDNIKWEVLRERSRELYGEGQRWYDLVRTGFLTNQDLNGGGIFPQSRFDADGWKWPVGRVLFLNNNVITQNSFWLGKVK